MYIILIELNGGNQLKRLVSLLKLNPLHPPPPQWVSWIAKTYTNRKIFSNAPFLDKKIARGRVGVGGSPAFFRREGGGGGHPAFSERERVARHAALHPRCGL